MVLSLNIDHTISKHASESIHTAQKKRLKDGMDKGFAVSQDRAPEDRGTLRQSGYQPTWKNDGSIEWGYRANHAMPMEKGTQPFQPPLQPLLEWSERVTGDKGLGFYVALHKIPESGIDAQPFAAPGAEATKDFLSSNSFKRYLDREL